MCGARAVHGDGGLGKGVAALPENSLVPATQQYCEMHLFLKQVS